MSVFIRPPGRAFMLMYGSVAVTCRARPAGYDEDGIFPSSPIVFTSRAVRQAHAGFDARGEKHGCSTAQAAGGAGTRARR
jgi:hypothetical protein